MFTTTNYRHNQGKYAQAWICANCRAKMIYTSRVIKPEYTCACGCSRREPLERRLCSRIRNSI